MYFFAMSSNINIVRKKCMLDYIWYLVAETSTISESLRQNIQALGKLYSNASIARLHCKGLREPLLPTLNLPNV